MKKEEYTKICPRCGSTKISPYTKMGFPEGEFLKDYCKDCLYGNMMSGGFFPEVKKSYIEKFRKQIKTKKQ